MGSSPDKATLAVGIEFFDTEVAQKFPAWLLQTDEHGRSKALGVEMNKATCAKSHDLALWNLCWSHLLGFQSRVSNRRALLSCRG